MRSHLVFAVKDYMSKGLLYGLSEEEAPEAKGKKVSFLLENDRFISDPDNYTVRALHHSMSLRKGADSH